MYSTHNKEKSVVDERFIKILMCKLNKYMTSISTNMYIDRLDYIVNKYNNIYQNRMKMKLNKPVDVRFNTYFDFNKENTYKHPNLDADNHVRISKEKNTFPKCYILN